MASLMMAAAPPAPRPPDLPVCAARLEEPCRIPGALTAAEVRALLGDRGSAWRVEDGTLHVVGAGARPLTLCCTFQAPLRPVAGAPDLWALSVHAPRLDEAVLDILVRAGSGAREAERWRGPKAPPAAPKAVPPAEWLHGVRLDSAAMGERRGLIVYAPPPDGKPRPVIYMADGGSVPGFAAIAHALAIGGRVREPVLVGLLVGPSGDAPADPKRFNRQRHEEYLLNFDNGAARFTAHERFLLDEVLPYAERTWGAAADPSLRAVMGYSDGAAWSLAMAARNPGIFRNAIALSFGWSPGVLPTLKRAPIANLYLAAGLYEPDFLKPTREAAGVLSAGGRVRFEVRAAGHGMTVWEDEFAEALPWTFPIG